MFHPAILKMFTTLRVASFFPGRIMGATISMDKIVLLSFCIPYPLSGASFDLAFSNTGSFGCIVISLYHTVIIVDYLTDCQCVNR